MTFLSYEGNENEIKELVADFCESLLARGFANDVEDSTQQLKSLIVVRENTEVLEMPPEIFFQLELENALMTVIPTEAPDVVTLEEETFEDRVEAGEFDWNRDVEEYEGEDGA